MALEYGNIWLLINRYEWVYSLGVGLTWWGRFQERHLSFRFISKRLQLQAAFNCMWRDFLGNLPRTLLWLLTAIIYLLLVLNWQACLVRWATSFWLDHVLSGGRGCCDWLEEFATRWEALLYVLTALHIWLDHFNDLFLFLFIASGDSVVCYSWCIRHTAMAFLYRCMLSSSWFRFLIAIVCCFRFQ